LKRNDYDYKENNRVISENNNNEEEDLMDEETKNYLEDMRKGTYNILVI